MNIQTYELLRKIYNLRQNQADGDGTEGEDVNGLAGELDAELIHAAHRDDELAVYKNETEYLLVGDVHGPWVFALSFATSTNT